MSRVHVAVITGCIAGTIAFGAYTRTLLRGVDLGDTGGFQAAVTSPEVSARRAYPLYFALARPFVQVVASDNPALGLNLFSAVAAALAIALLSLISTIVTASPAGGLASGLLFAFSYTWWHQAIIAEVYTLHLMLVGVCLIALWAYASLPGRLRLALFCAAYALAFGNHLSMILLFVPFALFLVLVSARPARLLRPATVAMVIAIALCGALQYVPELLALRHSDGWPRGLSESAAAFWFDVTKSDWRESMVLGVRESEVRDRLAMSGFDARQQFGYAGLALAAVGLVRLWMRQRAWAALLTTAYGINLAFAMTYNVGDPHVFFLPGHYVTAMCAGAALMPVAALRIPWGEPSWLATRTTRVRATGWIAARWFLSALVIAYAGWRGYDTWPAADRHADHRAEAFIERLTSGIDERDTVMAVDLDWQLENALRYGTRVDHRDVAWVDLNEVLLHFPLLVDANHAAQRDVVVTAQGAARIEAGFGPLFTLAPDGTPPQALDAAVDQIPAGAPYVLAILAPPRGESLDANTVNAIIAYLTKGAARWHEQPYEVIAGVSGQPAVISRASNRPFRAGGRINDASFDVRMDSWLPAETFRRGGFGHVIRQHQHVMALERGVNLIWFDGDAPSPPYYAAGVYAPQMRFRIPANPPGLARLR